MAATQPSPVPGLVLVPMALHSGLSVQECDDWYNNEHVPIRMRLPYFENGYRYRSVDGDLWGAGSGENYDWLAVYDIADMWQLMSAEYERLLTPSIQSVREKTILGKVSAYRKYFDLVSTYEADSFTPL